MSIELVRLNVNLNQETAVALRELAALNGITYTEAIRRSIAVYKFLTDEVQAGRKIHTMDQDGRKTREMVLM